VVIENAAGAICGMANAAAARSRRPPPDKPIVVASMFGNTTDCVNEAKRLVEAAGYEVIVFHATGTGGRAMEALIESGLVAGVLDITTTEWADEVCGGVLSAGPERLDAAARCGVPAIIVPGCLDMVNFGEPSSVPAHLAARILYHHNPQVTLMRTNATESAEIGRIIAEKVNHYSAPVTVLLPLRAISALGASGKPFHDPLADEALFGALKSYLRKDIPLLELDMEINEPRFAKACADELLVNLAAPNPSR
jgi:uncharacterized protein (UPF0261 family)